MRKKLFCLMVDIFFISISISLSSWLSGLGNLSTEMVFTTPYFASIAIISIWLWFYGVYNNLLRHISFFILKKLVYSSFVIFITVGLLYYPSIGTIKLPLASCVFSYIFLSGWRLVIYKLSNKQLSDSCNVLVFGAGQAGRQLTSMFKGNKNYRIVGFIDEDYKIKNQIILSHKVYHVSDLSDLVKKLSVKKIFLSIPSASNKDRSRILSTLAHIPVEVLSVPDLPELVSGKRQIDHVREVTVEELLGRDAVAPNVRLLHKNIEGKVVLVTGGGGSIGSELCRQIIKHAPSSLVIFDSSEYALYKINLELTDYLKGLNLETRIIPLLGNVRDYERLLRVMKSCSVQTVYHAAAYKHVPIVEDNIIEGFFNNAVGTYTSAKAALKANVETFVLISTDKAVRPTNVMGATKRLAELSLQALDNSCKTRNSTIFCMVRFGNVLGSSGSVIPLFKKQIASGGPITLTHPDITRFFMTIPEAAQLVIQAGAMGKGGEVFVLDMGEPVRIYDLAENLIHLSGFQVKKYGSNQERAIEIKTTGLRPGEKLYEELLISGDNICSTEHKRIMKAEERHLIKPEYDELISEMIAVAEDGNEQLLKRLLSEAPLDFLP